MNEQMSGTQGEWVNNRQGDKDLHRIIHFFLIPLSLVCSFRGYRLLFILDGVHWGFDLLPDVLWKKQTETKLQFVSRPAGGISGDEAHHGPAHSQPTLLLQPIRATEFPLVSAVMTLPTIVSETGHTFPTGHPTLLPLQGHTGVKGQRTQASGLGSNEERVRTQT